MRRRAYLRTAGLVASAGVTGCLGSETAPEAANEPGYPTTTADDIAVPLVPLADAIDWYENDAGVFVDARSRTAFENARIADAIHSPAPDGRDTDDPISELAEDTRLVTYCSCPHHLSTLRGAALIRNGYAHTYAIDEGFRAWREANYPLEGENVEETPRLFTIAGRTDPADTGDFAWIWHDPSGQREAAPIGTDGSFTLHARFYDVTPETAVRLSTPAGEVTEPLNALAGDVVDV